MYKRKKSVKQERVSLPLGGKLLYILETFYLLLKTKSTSIYSHFQISKIKYRREQEVSKGLGIVFDGNQQHWANIKDFRKRTTVRIELLINQATC